MSHPSSGLPVQDSARCTGKVREESGLRVGGECSPWLLVSLRLLCCTAMTASGCTSLKHNLSIEEVIQAFLSALPAPSSATAEYDLADEDCQQQIRVLKTGAALQRTQHEDPTCDMFSSYCSSCGSVG